MPHRHIPENSRDIKVNAQRDMTIPNGSIGTSHSITPQVEEGHAGDASGAPAAGSVARAALASVAAVRAASSAHAASAVTGIPRIPAHLLGANNVGGSVNGSVGGGAASSAAANAPDAPFVAIPGNDTLGIIAGYLTQEDQLVMRDIDAWTRSVVDPTIQTLKLTGSEACIALREPNALRNLRELHLTDCNDQQLIDLAAMLAKMRRTDFELIVTSNPFKNLVSVEGIAPMAALRLSGLTLKDIPVPIEMSHALARSVAPLTFNLPYIFDLDSNVFEISQLPQLRSLLVGRQALTPETIAALQAHAALEKLHVHAVSGSDICTLATSAHLQSLSISKIRDGEAVALRALADNRVLKSLGIAVDHADSLAVLSQNVTLKRLSVSVRDMPALLMSALSTMPALEDFDLSSRRIQGLSIGLDHIQALCEKPLKSLSFNGLVLDGATRLRLATAQTASLRLQFCTAFEDADFAALRRNQSITSLSIQSGTGTTSNDDAILSLVTSEDLKLESLMMRLLSKTPEAARKAIQTAWLRSGRPLSNLALDI